jgi:butyryl-CoA dehydrogenase
MWISNADHELAENIVHLVLAKIPGPDGRLVPGVRGLSLFIVPKHLADTGGRLTGERNDVCVAGLNHKLGHRGVPNALLNFGEGRQPVRGGPGAIGYRVGAPGAGLACMFHMMNEARIMIGLSAASIGHAGYEASLEYAKTRRQGRPPRAGGRDPASPPVAIVEHADVKRMLLAQKAYAEGGLALALFTADLVDRTRVGTAEEARDAKSLLEFLTPVAKSWSSEWCLEANSLAIQVHGGYGYTRDFLVELLWRDNRLNMIHEGTHGIQAIDLLGRKVVADGGAALDSLGRRIAQTVDAAAAVPAFESHVRALRDAWSDVRTALDAAWAAGDPETATASAVPFLQAFGHVVVAWLWLDVARAAVASGRAGRETPFAHGKCQAARYFFEYELPKVGAWLQPVARGTRACLEATLDALAE